MNLLAFALASALAAAPPPFTPPRLPDGIDPGDTASPWEPAADLPLRGGSSLELTSLTRTITTFTLGADVSALSTIDAAAEQAVLRHVAADPRWRLVVHQGALIAYRRTKDGPEWTCPMRGYTVDGPSLWRAAIRFTPWSPDAAWATSKVVAHADASAAEIQATGFAYGAHPGWDATALSWSGPEVSLELFEAGAADDLPHTAELLGIVPSYLGGLTTLAGTVPTQGWATGYLPAKEPKRGEPTVDVTSPGPGELEVRARMHVPGPGITWVRILDGELHPWEEQAVGVGTREIIGWADDEKALFYLQGRFPVPAGSAFTATIEVWHLPVATTADLVRPTGTPIRIGAFPVKVPRR